MHKVEPYRSETAALKSLDNGGRFYNVLSKADDGEITAAELSKVVGAFSSKQTINLHLAMSLADLSNRETILSSLSDDAKDAYRRYRPKYITPSTLVQFDESEISAGITAIITGVPKYQNDRTEFNGFISVPVTTNNITTMMMIPIIEDYDVYEVQDPQSESSFLLAHPRSKAKLAEVNTRFGGYVREWQLDEIDEADKKWFLEAHYYTPIID